MVLTTSKDEADLSQEKFWKSCSRAIKNDTKCVFCGPGYYAACALRITGIKVMGYNELWVVVSTKPRRLKIGVKTLVDERQGPD